MGIKKATLIAFVLLAILTVGAVSASDESDFNETLTVDDVQETVDVSLDDDEMSEGSEGVIASSESDVLSDDEEELILDIDTEQEYSTTDDLDETFASVTVPDGTDGNVTISIGDDELYNKAIRDFNESRIDGNTYNIALGGDDGNFLFAGYGQDDMIFFSFLYENGDSFTRVYFINLEDNTISFDNDDSDSPDNYEDFEGLSVFIMDMYINEPYSVIKVSEWPDGIDDYFDIRLQKDGEEPIITPWDINSVDRDRAGYAMWDIEQLQIPNVGIYQISFVFTVGGVEKVIVVGDVEIDSDDGGNEDIIWVDTNHELSTIYDLDETFAIVTAPKDMVGNVTISIGDNQLYNKALNEFDHNRVDEDEYSCFYKVALKEDGRFLFEGCDDGDMFYFGVLDENGDEIAGHYYFIRFLDDENILFESDEYQPIEEVQIDVDTDFVKDSGDHFAWIHLPIGITEGKVIVTNGDETLFESSVNIAEESWWEDDNDGHLTCGIAPEDIVWTDGDIIAISFLDENGETVLSREFEVTVNGNQVHLDECISEDDFGYWLSTHVCINNDEDICWVWPNEKVSEGTVILRIEKFDGTNKSYSLDIEQTEEIVWNLEDLDICNEVGDYTISLTYRINDNEIVLAENKVLRITELYYYICEDVYFAYPFDAIRFYEEDGQYVRVSRDGIYYDSNNMDPFRWTLSDLDITGPGSYTILIEAYDNRDKLVENFIFTLNVNDDNDYIQFYTSEFGVASWEIDGPVLFLVCPDEIIGDHLKFFMGDEFLLEFIAEGFMNWTLEDLGIDHDGDYEIRLCNERDDEMDVGSRWINVQGIDETREYVHIWDEEDGILYSDMDRTIVEVRLAKGSSGFLYILVDDEVKYVTMASYHGNDDEEGSFFGYKWNIPNLNLTQGGVFNITVVFFDGETNRTMDSAIVNVVKFDNSTFRARYNYEKYDGFNRHIEVFCPSGASGDIIVSIFDDDGELIENFTYNIGSEYWNKWNDVNYGYYALGDGYEAIVSVNGEEISIEEVIDEEETEEIQYDWISIKDGEVGPGDDIMIVSITYDRDVTNATVTVTNGEHTITKKLTDLQREWNANCYDYFVTFEDLEAFENFNDKDNIRFTFEFKYGKQSKVYCLKKDGDENKLYRVNDVISDMGGLFDILFPDEEEGDTAFDISDSDTGFIRVTVPQSYNVTKAEIIIASADNIVFNKVLTDFVYEFNYEFGMYVFIHTYLLGEMDFSSLNDRDLVNFTLIFDGEVMNNYQYRYRVVDENLIEFHEFSDKITAELRKGDVGSPEYGQSESDGNIIVLDIPNCLNVTEGTITVTDGNGNVFYSISLDEINNRSVDDESITYKIPADDFPYYTAMPEGVDVTFSFNYNDTQLVFGKAMRIGEKTYRHVVPEQVEKFFEITIPDRVLIDGNDNAIYIYTTPAANRQSVPIDMGDGHFNVYVNGKKVEDLGRLIRVDGETELDVARLENDYRYLYIYLGDLNITENGIYDLRIEYEESYTTSSGEINFITPLYENNITLASNVKVNYENESVEWLTGYGVDPVLMYLDTYYGDINTTTGKITVLNSDNATILEKNIVNLTYENGRYSLRYSDFTNKNFGDKITIKYGDGNERNGETSLDVKWRDVEPKDFNITVVDDLDDYYGNFVNLNIPELITTGQIIVTVKFKNNHNSSISNMNVTTDFDSHAVYTFSIADIKANYDNGKFALALSDLGFYEIDGGYEVDVKFSGDGESILPVANETVDVVLLHEISITINASSRYGIEQPFASVQIFEPMNAYAELYVDGVCYYHKTFEKGAVTFTSSDLWTPGTHTAEVKVFDAEFGSLLNSSTKTFDVLTQTENVTAIIDGIFKDDSHVFISFHAPKDGVVFTRTEKGFEKLHAVNQGNNNLDLGVLGHGNHTIWVLYNETLDDGSIAFYNNYLTVFVGDDGHWMVLPDPLVLNEEDTIKFNFGKGMEGNISIVIDGGLLNVTIPLVNGSAEFTINESLFDSVPDHKYGVHDYNITYSGDDTHDSLSQIGQFEVAYLFKDNLVKEGFPYREYYIIIITVPIDAKGNVTIIVNGQSQTVDVENGQAEFKVEGLEMGEHPVEISYSGDDRYPQSGYVNVLNVSYYGVVCDMVDGKRVVSLKLPANATGNLVVYNDNRGTKLFSKAVENGYAEIELTGLTVGVYELRAVYEGDDYDVRQFTDEFNVYPKVNITQDAVIDEDINIFVDLDNSTGYLLMVIDGKHPILKEIVDGKVNHIESTVGYVKGIHNVTFQYFGDSFDAKLFDNHIETFNLLPKPIEYKVTTNDNGELVIIVPDDVTGTIKVYEGNEVILEFDASLPEGNYVINGYDVAISVRDGTKTIAIDVGKALDNDDPTQSKGTFTVKLSGSDIYVDFSAGIVIVRKTPRIAASDLSMMYTSGKKYSVTVYGTNGKVAKGAKVTFLINGKSYGSAKTNAKGVASIVISKNPGNYKITSKALGVSITKKLTVTHLLKLKKVKVKRSAKKLVLTATLKKVNGKYLKGKKITFKFKGKKFKAKTNKKGVAKVTVKKAVLKKLKAGKKVKYQATYLKDTVKKSVKVKK